jgi:septal ring factor EnvC (AmiA/AmiB activator)
MATLSETAPEQPKSFRSPWRVLARSFEKSRDRWKTKYTALQERIKAFRTEIRDLRRARDRWQSKAEEFKRQLDELRAEMLTPAEQSPPAQN